LSFLVLSASAATAAAAIRSTSFSLLIPGIDSQGNPSSTITGAGSGKLYKEDHTGILVGFVTGTTLNRYGNSIVIRNQGYPFVDLWTKKTVTATQDIEVVSRPVLDVSKAALVVVYNPANNLP
jgi:hypothetical protein